jgi:cell division protein FtsW (lipid II flippase)
MQPSMCLRFGNCFIQRKGKQKVGVAWIFAAMVYAAGAVVLIATDPDLSMAIAFIAGFILLSIFTMILSRHYHRTSG